MFEPRPSTSDVTSCLAPPPMATSTTTAATPITTPSIVSSERSLLARRASRATRNDSVNLTEFPRFVLDQAVPHADDPSCASCDVGFVGHQHHRDSAFLVEPLKDRHHLVSVDGVEVACGFVREEHCGFSHKRSRYS